jgi:Ca2+-binding RTX toxin-like protein
VDSALPPKLAQAHNHNQAPLERGCGMARIRLFSGANVDEWPGRWFSLEDTTAYLVKTSTTLTVKHDANQPFANWSITFTGAGFTYAGDTPTGGTITNIVIRNAAGGLAAIIDLIPSASIGASLVEIMLTATGWPDGSGPDGFGVLSRLLGGNDSIVGTNGRDELNFGLGFGNDTIQAFGGDDYIAMGSGADTIDGGASADVLSYYETHFAGSAGAFRGIAANLNTGKILDC